MAGEEPLGEAEQGEAEHWLYDNELVWTRGRRGTLRAPGLPPFDVAAPPEFGGERGVWNPEQLLLAAANACLMSTFLSVAKKARIEVAGYWSSGTAHLTKDLEGGYAITEVRLWPVVMAQHAEDIERLEGLVRVAEGRCLIARSLKGKVRVEAKVRLWTHGQAARTTAASHAY